MIVVSILAPDFAEACRRALEQAAFGDAIELRLDRISNPGEAEFRALTKALGKPLLVAVNGPEAFGTFRGSVEERFDLLRAAARGGAAFVDVDHRLARALGPVAAPCRRIVSRHELDGVPSDLERARRELVAASEAGDVQKLVAHAANGEDGLALLELARAHGLVAFASGDRGRFTRVLAPIFGAPWTYAAPASLASATSDRDGASSKNAYGENSAVHGPSTAAQGPISAAPESISAARAPISAVHGPISAAHASISAVHESISAVRGPTSAMPGSISAALGATAPGQMGADVLRKQWPSAGVARSTSVLAVLGNPARHSLSPRLFNAAFRAAGVDATYVAIEPDDLAAFLARTQARNWRGFSVTAPFKEAAFALASTHDELARRARAANTLVREGDRWHACNTDAPAIRESVVAALERARVPQGALANETASESGGAHPLAQRACDARGRARLDALRVVVIGTGGAARAALVGLAGAEAIVVGRDPVRRAALASEFGARACSIDDLARHAPDVVVHCTPQGSRADLDAMPIPASALRREMLVLDAVYRPSDTPLLRAARELGAIAVSGDDWFARQMALQYELFTGARVETSLVRAELAAELDEDER